MSDRCEIPRCRDEADVIYLAHGICNNHWNQFTANDASPDALRMVLGIVAEHEQPTEEVMSKRKTAKSTDPKPEVSETASAAPEKKAKAAGKKGEKPPKTKREPKPKEDLCVFALRMTEQERTALHEAAGPANASRFARAVLIAAAAGDEAAFRQTIKDAREARA